MGRRADRGSWDRWFAELKEYKEKHGDCDVPRGYQENPRLGRWVMNQRRLLGREGQLETDRVRRLGEIGFYFGSQKLWDRRFAELKEYKEEHGDCKVPQAYPENPKLGRWVHGQRLFHSRGELAEDRVRRLGEIGFYFGNQKLWNLRFAELKEYKEEHGDCKVPQVYPENPKLGNWVHSQRRFHSRGELTEDRVRRLEEIGFYFGRNNGARWDQRFEELKKFKEEHGHCNVTGKYSGNPKLERWVRSQREMKNEKKLSEKRQKLLDGVGFLWDVWKNPPGPTAKNSKDGNPIERKESFRGVVDRHRDDTFLLLMESAARGESSVPAGRMSERRSRNMTALREANSLAHAAGGKKLSEQELATRLCDAESEATQLCVNEMEKKTQKNIQEAQKKNETELEYKVTANKHRDDSGSGEEEEEEEDGNNSLVSATEEEGSEKEPLENVSGGSFVGQSHDEDEEVRRIQDDGDGAEHANDDGEDIAETALQRELEDFLVGELIAVDNEQCDEVARATADKDAKSRGAASVMEPALDGSIPPIRDDSLVATQESDLGHVNEDENESGSPSPG